MSKRSLLLTAILAALTVLVVEGIAFLGLKVYEQRNPGIFINSFIERHFDGLSEEYYQDYVRETYHPVLGWHNKPGSERTSGNSAGELWSYSIGADGAREGNPFADQDPAVLTYGDSFTHGSEVDNDETWQVFLSRAIDGNVMNFGVPGYGTGQALLQFEQHLAGGLTAPTAILGVHEFNIARVVNGFRPFALPQSGARLGFKPAFIRDGGRIELYPNPFEPGMGLAELRAAAYDVAAYDYWAGQKLLLKWPYTWTLLKLAYRQTRGEVGRDYRRLWRSEMGREVMRHVVGRFVALAGRHDIQPILLLIPESSVMKNRTQPVYAPFLETVSREHPGLVIVDISQRAFTAEKFHVIPFTGHASPYGNRVIAEALAEALADAPGGP